MADFNRYYGIDFEQRIEGISHATGTVRSGEYHLAVHCWTLKEASSNLLLVHGYTDHTGLFGHLIEFGLRRGCNVIAFDLPGHGLSSGEPVAIDDFSEYSQGIVDVMAAAVVPDLPWWAMAQSTGCSALIDYAAKYPWKFTSTVFLAPLIRPVSWGKLRLGHVLLHRFKNTITRKFTQNSGDKTFLEFVQNDPLASGQLSLRWVAALRAWLGRLEYKDLGTGPILVVQGDADGTVDWCYNMEHICELFPGSQIELLPGAGHHLANETADLRRVYLEKVTEFVGLPISR
jgi:alpha-beta hydrolase superfamily lysophospholipase